MNRIIIYQSLLIVIATLIGQLGLAQRPDSALTTKTARIDSFLTVLVSHQLFNGSVLVAEQGRVIYKKSVGYADFNKRILNTDTTQFNLASLSKPFTAIAVLQLVQRKKLKLEDAFVTYFPDFPYPTITIRNLVAQTSGLPVLERYEDEYIKAHPEEIITNRQAYEHLIAQKKPLSFQPGDDHRYNNTNYFLLAMLVEKVSRMPFPAYLKKNVFMPAGMAQTYVREAGMRNTTRYTRPTMYMTTYHNVDSLNHNQFYTYYNLGSLIGPGNVVSTIQDLWRFDQALSVGKLISPALLEVASKPVILNNGTAFHMGNSSRSYGLGWSVYNSKKEPVSQFMFHDGHIVGLTTFLHRNLTKPQTIIFYDNTDSNPLQVMISLSNILNNQPPLTVQLKKSLVRVYGEALVTKGPDHAMSTFHSLKDDSTHYYVDELEMNRLGFDLLSASLPNHIDLSLEVFKLNTLLFPKSGNTYDSYAIALEKDGKKQEAIAMYRKSIVLWPGNEDGKKALKQLLEQKE